MRLAFIALLALTLLAACTQTNTTQTSVPPQPEPQTTTTVTTHTITQVNGSTPTGKVLTPPPPAPAITPDTNTKEFSVVAFQFGFDPSTITVNKGDHVKITFTSRDVTHGVGIEGYGIATSPFSQGQSQTLEFTADKSGTFAFFCDVYCGAGHQTMRGQLIVQ